MSQTQYEKLIPVLLASVLEDSELYPSYRLAEIAILREYLLKAENGVVSISNTRIGQLSGLSLDTARIVNKLLIQSKRWEVIPGVGKRFTTYRPLFLKDSETFSSSETVDA